jgi:hypothetical protein
MIYVARWVSRKRKYSDSGQKAREVVGQGVGNTPVMKAKNTSSFGFTVWHVT